MRIEKTVYPQHQSMHCANSTDTDFFFPIPPQGKESQVWGLFMVSIYTHTQTHTCVYMYHTEGVYFTSSLYPSHLGGKGLGTLSVISVSAGGRLFHTDCLFLPVLMKLHHCWFYFLEVDPSDSIVS